MNLVLGLIIGIAFGFIIHRTGASQYESILDTLRLKDLKILKFMVISIAVGMVGIYGLNMFGAAHMSIKTTYVLGVAIGGLIFGVGFALAGYCPGTAVCAVGEGKRDAGFAILGGLAGVLVYSFAYPVLKPILIDNLDFGKITLAGILPVPAIVTAVIAALLLAGAAFMLPKSVSDNE